MAIEVGETPVVVEGEERIGDAFQNLSALLLRAPPFGHVPHRACQSFDAADGIQHRTKDVLIGREGDRRRDEGRLVDNSVSGHEDLLDLPLQPSRTVRQVVQVVKVTSDDRLGRDPDKSSIVRSAYKNRPTRPRLYVKSAISESVVSGKTTRRSNCRFRNRSDA